MKYISLIFCILVTACASTGNEPDKNNINSKVSANKNIQLNTNTFANLPLHLPINIYPIATNQKSSGKINIRAHDLRTANFVIRYHSKDRAHIISPSNNIRIEVQNRLKTAFSDNGYNVLSNNSNKVVDVQIKSFIADLAKSKDYKGVLTVDLKLNASNGKHNISKTITIKRNTKTVEPLELENLLEVSLNQALEKIVNDRDLYKFLKQG